MAFLTQKEPHKKAVAWHVDFIKWVEKNVATDTDEYLFAKYAFDCIQKCDTRKAGIWSERL